MYNFDFTNLFFNMSKLYQGKSIEVIEAVIKRNNPITMYDNIDVQKDLIQSFPFNRGNLIAWKTYGREIHRMTKMLMFPYV